MKSYPSVLMLLMLMLATFQTFAQIKKVGDKVEMPVSTYQKIRSKFYDCDTLLELKSEQIALQDSIINNQKSQIDTLNILVVKKNKVIKDLEGYALKKEPVQKWHENKTFWIGGAIGIILGLLLSN